MFTVAQEEELTSHILKMESRLFGVTLTDLRVLAFDLAERNNIPNTFNKEKRRAGKAWMYAFLNRHPCLRLRTPEATSIGRAIGFNRTAVEKFFALLTEVCEKYKFPPDCIWNVDETGITTVPNRQSKVIGLRGKRQVGALVSAERGTLVTVETCMSAAGDYMPPMFIFPRKREKIELLDDAPPGSTAEFHPSGWIQKEIFIKWFKRFLTKANPSAEKPVLLLLDGHATHTKSIDLINMARENNVVLLCFPPHCTHRMQPLDVAFMAPLSTYYGEEARKWQRDHPGRCITIHQVGKLFGVAFMKAASVQTAVNGFRKTGIYPLNPGVFEDWMFAPSETTERPQIISVSENVSPIPPNPTRPNSPVLNVASSVQNISTPSSGSLTPSSSCTPKASCSFNVSPKELFKVPEAPRKQNNNDRRRGKTVILTSSPYKDELLAASNVVKNPKRSAVKKNLLPLEKNKKARCQTPRQKPSQHPKQRPTKKASNVDRNDDNSSSENDSSLVEDSSSEDDDGDSSCMYCDELFSNSKSGEGWVRCAACLNWSHEACADVEDEDDHYVCDFCSK